MRENRRLIKINEEIKKELNLIISFKLKNPHINGLITATKVNTTPDLKYSTVYISMMNKSDKEKAEILEALKKSKGFFKSEIARSINLRITPEFIFKEDDSLAYAEHMDELFRQIHEHDAKYKKDDEINDENEEIESDAENE